jgi:hypothetical protein
MALLSPIFNETHFKSDGSLANGYKIYTYIANSSTSATTYTTEAGDVAQANPIVLNARGEVNNPIWLADGVAYKFVFTTDTDVVIKTIDDIIGTSVPDAVQDQWIEYAGTATFISSTSFSVVGDQVSIFDVERALKLLTSGGTVYGTVATSSFGAGITTIVIDNATGVLDSGITGTAPSYGILSGSNNALPYLRDIIYKEGAAVVAASTTNIWATDGNIRHITGNTTITSFGTAPQAGARMTLIFDGTPLLTHGADLNLNAGTSNIQLEAGDYAEVYADTTTQFDVVVTRKSGKAIVTDDTAYGVSWNGNVDAPTKNAVYDKIESMQQGFSTVNTTTGGTTIAFTSVIPASANEFTVHFQGFSSSGTDTWILQVGVGGVYVTAGYESFATNFSGAAIAGGTSTNGMAFINATTAASLYGGHMTFKRTAETNVWTAVGGVGSASSASGGSGWGSIDAGGVIDSVRWTTGAGANTCDVNGGVSVSWKP